ncbi:hypothetical protein FGO68_gene29 [Halteria grandinella]|uniref:Uncharacterized protein n=1 Tax=Halteria grandinella TaxID=5974 RepID=A0A8J8NXX8_HALGN|nr:hypothetical protein FGO68_gene29 [Halteria grandinella]
MANYAKMQPALAMIIALVPVHSKICHNLRSKRDVWLRINRYKNYLIAATPIQAIITAKREMSHFEDPAALFLFSQRPD